MWWRQIYPVCDVCRICMLKRAYLRWNIVGLWWYGVVLHQGQGNHKLRSVNSSDYIQNGFIYVLGPKKKRLMAWLLVSFIFLSCLRRICVITLAESHPILRKEKRIQSINYQISAGCSRLQNKVSGKSKRVSSNEMTRITRHETIFQLIIWSYKNIWEHEIRKWKDGNRPFCPSRFLIFNVV